MRDRFMLKKSSRNGKFWVDPEPVELRASEDVDVGMSIFEVELRIVSVSCQVKSPVPLVTAEARLWVEDS